MFYCKLQNNVSRKIFSSFLGDMNISVLHYLDVLHAYLKKMITKVVFSFFSLTTAAIVLLASGCCVLSFRKPKMIGRGLETCFQYSGLAFRVITHSSGVYATSIRNPTCLQGPSLFFLTGCLWQEWPHKGPRITFSRSVQNTMNIVAASKK